MASPSEHGIIVESLTLTELVELKLHYVYSIRNYKKMLILPEQNRLGYMRNDELLTFINMDKVNLAIVEMASYYLRMIDSLDEVFEISV